MSFLPYNASHDWLKLCSSSSSSWWHCLLKKQRFYSDFPLCPCTCLSVRILYVCNEIARIAESQLCGIHTFPILDLCGAALSCWGTQDPQGRAEVKPQKYSSKKMWIWHLTIYKYTKQLWQRSWQERDAIVPHVLHFIIFFHLSSFSSFYYHYYHLFQ